MFPKLDIFLRKNVTIKKLDSTKITKKYLHEYYPEFLNYIIKTYKECKTISEMLYWYYNNIEDYPVCPICGTKLKYICFTQGYTHHCSKECANKDDYIIKKRRETTAKLHDGNPNFRNINKIKETFLKNYGVENIFEKKEYIQKCFQEKYPGFTNAMNVPEVKEKYKTSIYKHFGVDSFNKSEDFKEKKDEIQKKRVKSLNENNLKKYGVEWTSSLPTVQHKISETLQKKTPDEWENMQIKSNETKNLNKSFNTSTIEDEFGEWLSMNYFDYIPQYKSEEYPFLCDFYLPTYKLYIEINAHWTHGKHPFDNTNDDDLKQLIIWKEKSKESLFFKKAINVWTNLDIKKQKIAKENNLQYLAVYSNNLQFIKEAFLSEISLNMNNY